MSSAYLYYYSEKLSKLKFESTRGYKYPQKSLGNRTLSETSSKSEQQKVKKSKIQRSSERIAIGPESLISHLGIIKNHKTATKNKKKTTQTSP